ncbi:MAG: response regulator [Desulfobacteraceae bacterium]|nr:response regulator [Desulfobacteraceae bacterium]
MQKNIRILIAEDEAIIAMCLEMDFRNAGYNVCGIVAKGEDVVIRADQEKPDIILMDIGLSGKINGIEAALQIRSHCDIPIIFMTGYQDEAMIEQANKIHKTVLFHKPVNIKDVEKAIEAF